MFRYDFTYFRTLGKALTKNLLKTSFPNALHAKKSEPLPQNPTALEFWVEGFRFRVQG